jgi:hypothetical protein
MTVQHQQLTSGHWQDFSLLEQLANIGSEVDRTIAWRLSGYGDPQDAFYRALELLDLTIADPKNKFRLKEVCRMREVLLDWFTGSNSYNTTDTQWQNYFYQFGYAARNLKGYL